MRYSIAITALRIDNGLLVHAVDPKISEPLSLRRRRSGIRLWEHSIALGPLAEEGPGVQAEPRAILGP